MILFHCPFFNIKNNEKKINNIKKYLCHSFLIYHYSFFPSGPTASNSININNLILLWTDWLSNLLELPDYNLSFEADLDLDFYDFNRLLDYL